MLLVMNQTIILAFMFAYRGTNVMSKKPQQLSHSKMIKLDKIAHKSTTKSPVKLAWEIFTRNKHLVRKDCLNLAIRAGVAFYTARTQYHAWKMAEKNDLKAAEKSAALMAKLGFKPKP